MSTLIVVPILAFAFVFGCMVGYLWRDDHNYKK